MKRTVLESSTFKGFAFQKVETFVVDLMDEDDLPEEVRKDYNSVLMTYGVYSYPTALFAYPDTEIEMARVTGYDRRGPNLYVKKLEEAMSGL